VVGTKNVCVNATSASSRVYITFNGIAEGPITGFGGSRVYIDANGPRYVTSC
jgi:hypothetical protein